MNIKISRVAWRLDPAPIQAIQTEYRGCIVRRASSTQGNHNHILTLTPNVTWYLLLPPKSNSFFRGPSVSPFRRISSTSCVRLFIIVCWRTVLYLVDLIMPSAAASACQSWSEINWVDDRRTAVPRTLSSFGDRRSFGTAGPRAWKWNKLPSHLRLMQSADTFRRHLKTFLFHQAFLSWHC